MKFKQVLIVLALAIAIGSWALVIFQWRACESRGGIFVETFIWYRCVQAIR